MDRDLLEAWLEQGRSLTEIGALTGRDPSTVGYWLRKHRLVANGREKYAPRGGLTRKGLEPLVNRRLTLAEIAAEVDRSESTVRYWIARHGLNRPSGRRRQDVEQAIREGRRTVVRHCHRHGETEFALVGDRRYPRCKGCRAEAVARRRRKVKQILVEEAGGKCVLCGYHRSLCALQFHHLDPAQKAFGIAQGGITRSIDDIRQEVARCVLLCSNCHAEVEGGDASLSDLTASCPV
jgi:5-methylcytosine-specific restriction endonuclease McrA